MGIVPQEIRTLRRAIEDLLWQEWDPIGVNDIEGAEGEYDSYALEVVAMLKRGEGEEAVTNHLNFIERELMGLGSQPARNSEIAKRAVEIYRSKK